MKAKITIRFDGIETTPDGTRIVKLAVEFLGGEIRAVYRKGLGGPGGLIHPPGVALGPRVVHRLMDTARKHLEALEAAPLVYSEPLKLIK